MRCERRRAFARGSCRGREGCRRPLSGGICRSGRSQAMRGDGHGRRGDEWVKRSRVPRRGIRLKDVRDVQLGDWNDKMLEACAWRL